MASSRRAGRDRFRGQDPLELWLARALHRAHDGVAEEAVPDDLLRLVAGEAGEWAAMKARWTVRAEG